jgi:exopolysaccharide biosynthesis polyprenyl glycosylphosphotransferase
VLEARGGEDIRLQLTAQLQAPSFRRILPMVLAAQDALLIYFALLAAYWARYAIGIGPYAHDAIPFSGYQGLAILLLGILMPTLFLKGTYRARLSTEIVDEMSAIFGAVTVSVASIVVVTFMLHQFEYSRGVIVYLWIFLITFLVLGRILSRRFQALCHQRGLGVQRLLVVGASGVGKMIMQSVRSRPDLGYEVVGFVDRRSASRVPDFGRFQRLGTISDIPTLVESQRIHEVIVALPGSAHEQVWPIVRMCEKSGVRLKLVPDLFEMSLSRVQVDTIAGVPLLDVQEKPARRIARATKRLLDILAGSTIALISIPILAGLALLIKLDSEGPVFIKQERVGRNGRRFSCWKLRTMHVGADKLLALLQSKNETKGPIFKIRNDPRITRVGRYIRRLSLDELPQAWNVVQGDMSLVGPRPPLPHEVENYEDWQLRRLEATPGITGIWQVSGRSNLTFDEMVMMDITYIDSWSFGLDLKILFRTISAVLAARGAY